MVVLGVKNGDVLTSSVRLCSDLQATPSELFQRVADREGAVWVDSAVGNDPGAISILGWEPEEVWSGRLGEMGPVRRWLRQGISGFAGGTMSSGFPEGGAFGYLTYEGEAVFGLYRKLLVYQHRTGNWYELGECLSSLPSEGPSESKGGFEGVVPLPTIGRDAYCEQVRRAQEYIAAGDVYQVNLAQQFQAPWPSERSAFALYRHLRQQSPAPNAAYYNLGGRQILSSSPEEFLKMSGASIRTRPIKGTRPRFPENPQADAESAEALVASEKERAELIMITDLLRNDLGQICEFGSVKAVELLKLESFEQVFHLVSTVEGRLREDVDHVSAIEACFPGGSITGAPKKRAREIIAELEGRPRGPYTGAMGYLGLNGESQMSIGIRTVVVENGMLEFQVGAGIVADSSPEAEYEETLHKAAGILGAIESLRLDLEPSLASSNLFCALS